MADNNNTYMHHARRKYAEWRECFDDDKRFAWAIAYWYVTKRVPEFPELAVESREHRTLKEDNPPTMNRCPPDNDPTK